MTPEEWQRIKAIAAQLLDLPPAERAARIAGACGHDASLQAEIERLLESTDAAADLYEQPLLAGPVLRHAVEQWTGVGPAILGAEFGPYRIVRELGRGGMGQVYFAERTDGAFDQRVAIKFIAGLPTEQAMQRFIEERRILASLDHPNIARLIDGGATPVGHPYVVMEYVDGVPIDEFCLERSLSVPARVQMLLRVCDAVQYAHQRLVIHRDLKAANILVTADGTPKLLDFGIAKLVDANGGQREATRTMFRQMTIETASPEQLRGDPVTTATDVYALGGLLYRLLTGRTPYDVDAQNEADWIRAVSEQEPVAPSRRTRLFRGSATIDRDLDLIVLKALRKAPDRRYATVTGFADDLQRYLDGRPVVAAPDGVSYRLRKLIRRHRVAFAAGAALAVAMIAGTLATAREAQIAQRERARAEGRFDDVRQLANAFMFEVHDAIETLPGSTPARRLLISRVLEYLEKLTRDAGAESRLQLEIATAYQKIGNVQGNPYVANVGDAAGAMQSYQKALALTQALVEREPSAPHRAALASSHHLVGDMQWAQGAFADALVSYRRAAADRERLVEGGTATETTQLELASSYYAVGQTLLRAGDYQGAVAAYTRSQSIQSTVAREHPSNRVARRAFATSTAKLGDVLAVQGNHARALEYHTKSAEVLQEAADAAPDDAPNTRLLAMVLYRVAVDEKETGDYRRATTSARRALALQQRILGADPANVQARTDVASTRRILGDALLSLNEIRDASEELGQAEKALRVLLASNPRDAQDGEELAMTLLNRGSAFARLGDPVHARNAYVEAASLLKDSSRADAIRYRVTAYERAGDVEREFAASARASDERIAHERAACAHYREALAALRQSHERGSDDADLATITTKTAACAGRSSD